MNTFDFANRVENMAECICSAFDELMILYHLMGVRDDTRISFNQDSKEVEFNVYMNTVESAKELYETFDNTYFNICDTKFIINMELIDDCVSTIIKKAIY